jgi:hypothetical protein
MANIFAAYEVSWNGEDMGVVEMYEKIKKGEYPDSLTIFHPRSGTVSLGKPGLYGADYTVSRAGPPLDGTRFGIARTWGNAGLDEGELIEYITNVFKNLQHEIENVLYVGRKKLLRTQLEAAKKMANKAEKNLGENVPRELRNKIAQMIGEQKPVTGAWAVENNVAKINSKVFNDAHAVERHMKKINTSLFEGGRRGKKTRRTNHKNRKASRRSRQGERK